MRNINISVYKFNELSKEIQNKVIQRYREELANFLYASLDNIMNWEFKKYTDNLDFELAYSLNSCQGDGVSFTGNM